MANRQDKATNERNAKTLRELIKLPQNKFCADCKRNDARWASWNIGCFVCIRCSGIHRSMGTHISKVKSIDLDMWTPEQLASVQKWGNTRVNLYWEAHLKPGHLPPDHKMDSFIRSKYESKRWALEGPPPSDPSVLDHQSAQVDVAAPSTSKIADEQDVAPAPPIVTNPSLIHDTSVSPPKIQHTLLSSSHNHIPSTSSSAVPTSTAQNDLFSLDFSSPQSVSSAAPPARTNDVKQDIMSLFASNANAPAQAVPFNAGSSTGTGGASPWVADVWSNRANAMPNAQFIWQDSQYTAPQNVWTASSQSGSDLLNSGHHQQSRKQDDAFGDLWGGFK